MIRQLSYCGVFWHRDTQKMMLLRVLRELPHCYKVQPVDPNNPPQPMFFAPRWMWCRAQATDALCPGPYDPRFAQRLPNDHCAYAPARCSDCPDRLRGLPNE